MFRKIRAIHLCTSLFTLAFLVMYGLSAVQMAHNKWFASKPQVVTQSFTLTPNLSGARPAARELMDRHGLRGELRAVQPHGANLSFRLIRPGTVYEVEYIPASGLASVRTNTAGVMGMLNRLHHVEGLWHDYPLLNIWGALVGLVSIGLFLLGATGFYLWFENHRERWIGGACLALGVVLTVALIASMRAG